MKLLVISDSHLYGNHLQRVVDQYQSQVDYMIHCGDSSLPMDDPYIQKFDIVVEEIMMMLPILFIKHFKTFVSHMVIFMVFILDMIN